MAFKLAFSTLRWKNPDLEPCLVALKEAGWAGWECRLPLDWLGTPQRLRRICDKVGLPMVVYTAGGSPDDRSFENVELNRRRMEFAAEVGADCFMYMNGAKPENRPVTKAEIGYNRWLTCGPGEPIVSPLEEAKRSKATLHYLKEIGF